VDDRPRRECATSVAAYDLAREELVPQRLAKSPFRESHALRFVSCRSSCTCDAAPDRGSSTCGPRKPRLLIKVLMPPRRRHSSSAISSASWSTLYFSVVSIDLCRIKRCGLLVSSRRVDAGPTPGCRRRGSSVILECDCPAMSCYTMHMTSARGDPGKNREIVPVANMIP